jgi:transposase
VVQPPRDVLSIRPGYEQFQAWLREQLASGRYQPVIIGMEPTGIYHESWLDALLADYDQQVAVRLLNPFAVRQKRAQLHGGRKKKTDALDDEAIAHCLRDGLGYLTVARDPQQLRFSLWATAIRQTQQALYQLDRQVLTQCDRLWPSALLKVSAFQRAHPHLEVPEPLVRTQPLASRLVQLLLEYRPNPYDWLPASPAAIQAFYRAHHLGCGPYWANKVLAVLQRSLFPPPAIAALLAEELHDTFQQYQHTAQHLTQVLGQAEDLVPGSPAAVLTTAPGIGVYTAARYVAFVGDPWRFQHADQIWSLAGYDLIVADSGDRRRVGKITKHGDGALRQLLFSIGVTMAKDCPAIAAAKRHACQHGKGKVGAILHAAHKANRLLFRLLRDQVRYDPTLAR